MSKITAADIRDAIRARYPVQSHAVLFEVADATGARATRWADALVMSLWPSHGLTVDGFEIKVSRHDWLKERANPAKAEAIAKYCDHWWLVTAKGVVEHASEVPDAWGWMECGGTDTTGSKLGLQIVRSATKTDALPLDRLFVASVLRSAQKLDEGIVERRVAEMRADDEARIEREIERRRQRDSRYAALITKAVQTLGEDSLYYLGDEQFLGAMAFAHKARFTGGYGSLPNVLTLLDELRNKVAEILAELGIEQPKPKRRRRAA